MREGVHKRASPGRQGRELISECQCGEQVSGNKAELRQRLHAAIVRDYLHERAEDQGV